MIPDRMRTELIERAGPAPDDALSALAHVLRNFPDRPSDEMALMATSGIYADGVQTGLTWGDLRRIAALLGIEPT